MTVVPGGFSASAIFGAPAKAAIGVSATGLYPVPSGYTYVSFVLVEGGWPGGFSLAGGGGTGGQSGRILYSPGPFDVTSSSRTGIITTAFYITIYPPSSTGSTVKPQVQFNALGGPNLQSYVILYYYPAILGGSGGRPGIAGGCGGGAASFGDAGDNSQGGQTLNNTPGLGGVPSNSYPSVPELNGFIGRGGNGGGVSPAVAPQQGFGWGGGGGGADGNGVFQPGNGGPGGVLLIYHNDPFYEAATGGTVDSGPG